MASRRESSGKPGMPGKPGSTGSGKKAGGWRNQPMPAGPRKSKSDAVDAPAKRETGRGPRPAAKRLDPKMDRDERRRQGSLDALAGRKEIVAEASALAANSLPDKPLLMMAANPGLEQRVHAWLDVLIYVWRRRKIGEQARFIRNAHLKADEVAVLGPAIQQLSRGFTGHRNLVGKTYLDDPDLLGAYLLFYWPVSYAQAWTVLADQERRHGLPDLARIADLGCGPGPLSCALLDMAFAQSAERKVEALALDHSPQALILLEEVVRIAYGPQAESRFHLVTRTWDGGKAGSSSAQSAAKPLLEGHFDCISAGHFLNELWSDLVPAQAESKRGALLRGAAASLRPASPPLAPAFLMVLEPALKPTTRSLLAVRDQIVAAGLTILGPCLFQGNCPALAAPEGTCHGQVFWELPGMIRQLAKVAHLAKEELAMAWLTVGVPGAATTAKGEGLPLASGDGVWRITSEAMLNKAGRTRFMICGETGRTSLSLKQGELLTALADGKARNRAQTTEKTFFGLRRGDAILLRNPVERDSGWGVGPETRIELE